MLLSTKKARYRLAVDATANVYVADIVTGGVILLDRLLSERAGMRRP